MYNYRGDRIFLSDDDGTNKVSTSATYNLSFLFAKREVNKYISNILYVRKILWECLQYKCGESKWLMSNKEVAQDYFLRDFLIFLIVTYLQTSQNFSF